MSTDRPADADHRVDDTTRSAGAVNEYRRQVLHDIGHELGTINTLGSLLVSADDVGATSAHHIRQLLDGVRWLLELVRIYDVEPAIVEQTDDRPGAEAVVRLDVLLGEIAATLRLVTSTTIDLECSAVAVRLPMLPLRRAVRNIVANGVAAAGPHGQVILRSCPNRGVAIVEVEDDGPGPQAITDARREHPDSLGLNITSKFVRICGGTLNIETGRHGGSRVRILLPEFAGTGDAEP